VIDHTHAADRRSWVESANGHPDFPIQNLPLGWFSTAGAPPRAGIAIGDSILDLAAVAAAGLLPEEVAGIAAETSGLNGFLGRGRQVRQALRVAVGEILDAAGALARRESAEALARRFLVDQAGAILHLPAVIGDYTDFYAGIHHAENAGALLRPENPLLPNYKYLPVAYHGRASSILASGAEITRPNGQRRRPAETEPSFGPSRNLDYELELGIWIGPGNAQGEAIPITQAADHIAGFCLFNDWSARDIQGWEYQPLGPFLGKNFASMVSPWIVTPEALAPFRAAQKPRPAGDPKPLDYLWDGADQAAGALGLDLEILIETEAMREAGLPPSLVSQGDSRNLYWTPAQMVTHHSSGGCNLRPGDLFGTGTISGPAGSGAFGCLLEMTKGGREEITLASGETRRFLDDGDTVILRAHARREGFAPIGFGECRGRVVPARALSE
jgi:fumarylacetoacetase